MKNPSRLLIAAAALALFASAGQVKAQSQAVGDDGIAASPKVRQMLNERKARNAAPLQVTINLITSQATIAGSPKDQQMRNERMPALVPQTGGGTVGYMPTGPDGITASPKVRQMLDERRQTVEIAPLK
jgi:hypothetical protein